MVQPEHAESQWQLCPAPGGKDVIGPVVPRFPLPRYGPARAASESRSESPGLRLRGTNEWRAQCTLHTGGELVPEPRRPGSGLSVRCNGIRP